MSVQNKNVNITIYGIPKKIRLAETGISKITHAYMPRDFYDEFELEGNTVFARKNGVFVSLISNGELKFKPYDPESLKGLFSNLGKELEPEYLPQKEFDLCREGGEYHIYVTELSDSDTESYDEFKRRIRSRKTVFGENSAAVQTVDGILFASYDGKFTINEADGRKVFDRYECRFCTAKRKPDKVFIDSGKNTLSLRIDTVERAETAV